MTPKHPLKGTKFMMVLDPKIEKMLQKHADRTGIGIQQLLRTRVIPDWLFGPPIVSNRVIQRLQAKGLIKKHG